MLVVPSEPCAYGTYTSGAAGVARLPYRTSSATPTMVKRSGCVVRRNVAGAARLVDDRLRQQRQRRVDGQHLAERIAAAPEPARQLLIDDRDFRRTQRVGVGERRGRRSSGFAAQ